MIDLPWPVDTPLEPLPKRVGPYGRHLSFSQLSTFIRCPEQYRQRYLLGIKSPSGGALVHGSAVHKALGWMDELRKDSGLLINPGDLQDVYSGALNQEVFEAEEKTGLVQWGKKSKAEIEATGRGLMPVYLEELAGRTADCRDIEMKVEFELPGLPVPLLCYLDVVTGSSIVERKTAGASVSKPKPDWQLQAAIYETAIGMPVEWHVLVGTKKPRVLLLPPESNTTRGERQQLVDKVNRFAVRIRQQFEQNGPDKPWDGDGQQSDWACNYCSYRPRCYWWQVAPEVAL